MGFYKETQAFEQRTQIKSMNQHHQQQQQDNVKCTDGRNIESSTKQTANILEASTTSNSSSIFASIKSLFTSNSIEHHSSYSTSSDQSCEPQSQRPSQSSGYSSFMDSWDVDDSYVKVSKFSGKKIVSKSSFFNRIFYFKANTINNELVFTNISMINLIDLNGLYHFN